MRHTKGPWKAESHRGSYEIWNQNTKIAVINEAHEQEQEIGMDLANANLIAAAPEMLEALEIALIRLQQLDTPRNSNALTLGTVVGAIKKARGEA